MSRDTCFISAYGKTMEEWDFPCGFYGAEKESLLDWGIGRNDRDGLIAIG